MSSRRHPEKAAKRVRKRGPTPTSVNAARALLTEMEILRETLDVSRGLARIRLREVEELKARVRALEDEGMRLREVIDRRGAVAEGLRKEIAGKTESLRIIDAQRAKNFEETKMIVDAVCKERDEAWVELDVLRHRLDSTLTPVDGRRLRALDTIAHFRSSLLAVASVLKLRADLPRDDRPLSSEVIQHAYVSMVFRIEQRVVALAKAAPDVLASFEDER